MMSYLGYSQSLTPLVLKIDNKKYYCYDSSSIRKVAVYLNNAFTCDTLEKEYNSILSDYDSLEVVKFNLEENFKSQLKIEEKKNSLERQKNDLYLEEIKKLKKKGLILTVIAGVEVTLLIISIFH